MSCSVPTARTQKNHSFQTVLQNAFNACCPAGIAFYYYERLPTVILNVLYCHSEHLIMCHSERSVRSVATE